MTIDPQPTDEPEPHKEDARTHLFVGYRANPTICSICGAVKPWPCYLMKDNRP